MTVQSFNNNLNYWIDPTFTTVNRLFVLSLEREENNVQKDHRDSFSYYYVPHVEIKGLNVVTEKVSLTCHKKMNKKLTRKVLRWVEIMTTQLVTYWILPISKKIKY